MGLIHQPKMDHGSNIQRKKSLEHVSTYLPFKLPLTLPVAYEPQNIYHPFAKSKTTEGKNRERVYEKEERSEQ